MASFKGLPRPAGWWGPWPPRSDGAKRAAADVVGRPDSAWLLRQQGQARYGATVSRDALAVALYDLCQAEAERWGKAGGALPSMLRRLQSAPEPRPRPRAKKSKAKKEPSTKRRR